MGPFENDVMLRKKGFVEYDEFDFVHFMISNGKRRGGGGGKGSKISKLKLMSSITKGSDQKLIRIASFHLARIKVLYIVTRFALN